MKKDENLDKSEKPKSLWRKIMDTPISKIRSDRGMPNDARRFYTDDRGNPIFRISWYKVTKYGTNILIVFVIIMAARAIIRVISSVATSVTPTMNTTTTSTLATPLSFMNSSLFWIIIVAVTPALYMIWKSITRAMSGD